MGDPKKQRKKYDTPKKPYDRTRIEEEKKVKKDFGLRRKKEIWRAESVLRNFRRRARRLQAQEDEEKSKELFKKMADMGISCANLEEVLEVKLENILARRLQTVLHKKGIAHTPKHARQLIVHGHVLVDGRKVMWPSFIVGKDMEDKISVTPKMSKVLQEEDKEGKE